MSTHATTYYNDQQYQSASNDAQDDGGQNIEQELLQATSAAAAAVNANNQSHFQNSADVNDASENLQSGRGKRKRNANTASAAIEGSGLAFASNDQSVDPDGNPDQSASTGRQTRKRSRLDSVGTQSQTRAPAANRPTATVSDSTMSHTLPQNPAAASQGVTPHHSNQQGGHDYDPTYPPHFIATGGPGSANDPNNPETGANPFSTSPSYALTDVRNAGIYSAAALFRKPSSASKKYTRPPMAKLFTSLELSPENFLRLQALAKQYMLDPRFPDRQDCVGNRGKGDSDIVKLKLYHCVREFLEEGSTGELYFGENSEGVDRRGWSWPHDVTKVISLVTPLLRRMVSNERQRRYAVETRSGKKPVEKRGRRHTTGDTIGDSSAQDTWEEGQEGEEEDDNNTMMPETDDTMNESLVDPATALEQWKGRQHQPPQDAQDGEYAAASATAAAIAATGQNGTNPAPTAVMRSSWSAQGDRSSKVDPQLTGAAAASENGVLPLEITLLHEPSPTNANNNDTETENASPIKKIITFHQIPASDFSGMGIQGVKAMALVNVRMKFGTGAPDVSDIDESRLSVLVHAVDGVREIDSDEGLKDVWERAQRECGVWMGSLRVAVKVRGKFWNV